MMVKMKAVLSKNPVVAQNSERSAPPNRMHLLLHTVLEFSELV
jgi:hypothetical protein